MTRNLLIVRAGDKSLHPGWLDGARNWDIIVNYYGDDPDIYRRDGVTRVDSKGPKWPALHALLNARPELWRDYDYICLPDDDLVCESETLNRFFDLCTAHRLELAQPALSFDSYIGVPLTLVNKAFTMRFTNIVEIMAPCFSRALLERCIPSFAMSQTGWGLDYLWPRWASAPDKAAIVDATVIRHTRPVGTGPNTRLVKGQGTNTRREFLELMIDNRIWPVPMITGGLDLEGKLHAIWNHGHKELMRRVIAGYLPELANYPDKLFDFIAPIVGDLNGDNEIGRRAWAEAQEFPIAM